MSGLTGIEFGRTLPNQIEPKPLFWKSPLKGTPAWASLRKPMLCSSVHLLFFISVITECLTDFAKLSLVRVMG